jgi:hypothetical protein
MLGAAIVLGFLAFNYQGSPRMDDLAKVQKGVTIPNPTELSPAKTTGAGRRRSSVNGSAYSSREKPLVASF